MGKTLYDKAVVRQFARANTGSLAGNNPALHTTNTENGLEMKWEAEEIKFQRIGKVNDFWDMWQGS